MDSADVVLLNAQIYTVSDARPRASALAVRDGRFIEVGESESLLDAHPSARVLNAEGRTVIPGFIDAHAHLQELGRFLSRADLTDTSSPDEVVARLKSFVAQHDLPNGAWLRGHGWDQTDWPSPQLPSRKHLDAAFPDRPVWLTRTDVHAGWANTAALQATIGLNGLREMSELEDGRVDRNEDGRPTGVLVDEAMSLVENQIPPPTEAESERALHHALQHAARHGITGLHDAGVDLDTIRRYRRFIENDTFRLRVHAMIDGRGDTFDYFSERGPLFHRSGRLQVNSVKFFADGALGSHGAALLDDYTDDSGNRGFLPSSKKEFRRNVRTATERGFQVNTHAIGDRANRFVLDAYEAAMRRGDKPMRRPRIEHAQIVHPNDRPRFGHLDVIASVQPGFATSDMGWAARRLGPDRIERAYAWKSLEDVGAHLAFGSDAPVEPVDPLHGFHAAVTRQDADGQPSGGWQPAERVSRATALRAYTLNAAHAAFMEDEVGSITPGKRADFVVLSEDLMDVPASRLLDTEVLATYVNGTATYTTDKWPDG